MGAAAFVQEHGQPFRPVPLLKGMRRRRSGNCYAVAGGLALEGKGFYVEGFAHHPRDPAPIKHAWITTDGTDAIDPSCEHALECSYFGVPFSHRALSRLLIARGYHGQLDPVDEVLREALGSDPAVFPYSVTQKAEAERENLPFRSIRSNNTTTSSAWNARFLNK